VFQFSNEYNKYIQQTALFSLLPMVLSFVEPTYLQ